MGQITFQILEGVDKGRIFRNLAVPVTIGREEGNLLRLNDERVSRFHAKVQQDDGDFILTDLDSTNGTRVNGSAVQIRRLRFGDRVSVGRSLLLFGSTEQIAARMAQVQQAGSKPVVEGTIAASVSQEGPNTIQADEVCGSFEDDVDFDLNVKAELTTNDGNLFLGNRELPPLPQKLTPAQAARLAEILEFLHRRITRATERITANEDATQVGLAYTDWQQILALQMLVARYLRAISDPDALSGG